MDIKGEKMKKEGKTKGKKTSKNFEETKSYVHSKTVFLCVFFFYEEIKRAANQKKKINNKKEKKNKFECTETRNCRTYTKIQNKENKKIQCSKMVDVEKIGVRDGTVRP